MIIVAKWKTTSWTRKDQLRCHNTLKLTWVQSGDNMKHWLLNNLQSHQSHDCCDFWMIWRCPSRELWQGVGYRETVIVNGYISGSERKFQDRALTLLRVGGCFSQWQWSVHLQWRQRPFLCNSCDCEHKSLAINWEQSNKKLIYISSVVAAVVTRFLTRVHSCGRDEPMQIPGPVFNVVGRKGVARSY